MRAHARDGVDTTTTIRKRFEQKVIKLVDVEVPNFRVHFKDGVLKACDEVYGNKRGGRSKGDTWWWNEEVKEAVIEERCTEDDVSEQYWGE